MGRFVAVSDITSYGGHTGSDDDALIGNLILRAEAIIEGYCGRKFQSSSSNEATHNFDYTMDVIGNTLYLDDDLNTIVSVTAGTDSVAASNYVTLPRSSKPYYAIQIRDGADEDWTQANSDGYYEGAIAVAGQWAYSSAAPVDIQHAAIRLTRYLYKQRETDAELDRPLLTQSGITIMPARLPQDVLTVLDFYKKRMVFP